MGPCLPSGIHCVGTLSASLTHGCLTPMVFWLRVCVSGLWKEDIIQLSCDLFKRVVAAHIAYAVRVHDQPVASVIIHEMECQLSAVRLNLWADIDSLHHSLGRSSRRKFLTCPYLSRLYAGLPWLLEIVLVQSRVVKGG